ncbi:hypothetical protein M409DRAFT_53677 [Zasmidium cellare ATCC 36951]|uniref:O-methyltransferase C-terminal domain-containing protein n=1 Tax=Zasmidium cellare ATCC 36951 TaxID=1080233 RepID=A0A6A6CKE2_ZASCE|nr:uncharacterized protein M409DRAFT_53677 [Zasmidium cellare ATCC 36951]KAF2167694.1 hypothetical protein M409DRAFT_53677 [Zasmidium cellare ATCC 36951]
MAELAKLTATVAHLEQIVHDDGLCDRLHEGLVADAQLRHRVEEALRRANLRLQGAGSISESLATTGFDLAIAHIGCQLNIWTTLVIQAPTAVEADALAATAGVDGALMLRLLRYGAAHDMVKQVDRTTFRASKGTERLAKPSVKDAILVSVDMLAPMALSFPAYLESIKRAEPDDPNNTAWTFSIGKGQDMFAYMAARPLYADAFNRHMTFLQENTVPWLHNFPLEQYMDVNKTEDRRVQFCDVAGGNGHQALNVVQKYPTLEGRVVVQDRPDMTFTQHTGVEHVSFDLFQPNPTKGARVYYLRHILHDWPDEQGRTILTHLRAVMENDSVIIVNEMVIRDVDTRHYSTSFDISMAMGFAAKERTDHEWSALFTSAGLKRVDLVEYDPRGMSLQVLTPQ